MSARVVVVTGTSTEVGKTIATSMLAAWHARHGSRVVVVKPVQTGVVGDEDGDAAVVGRLAEVPTQEWVRLPDPLAPDTAARRAGVALPRVAEHAGRVRALAEDVDVVVVEGAGGLLVRLDRDGGTLLDLAADLAATHEVEVYVVCAAGLGTLNHTELTVLTLRARGIEPAGLVVGSWPSEPDLAATANLEDLPWITGVPIVAVVPEGAGALDEFRERAAAWFSRR